MQTKWRFLGRNATKLHVIPGHRVWIVSAYCTIRLQAERAWYREDNSFLKRLKISRTNVWGRDFSFMLGLVFILYHPELQKKYLGEKRGGTNKLR